MRKQNDNMKYVTHSYYLFSEFIVISKDKYDGKRKKLKQEEKSRKEKTVQNYNHAPGGKKRKRLNNISDEQPHFSSNNVLYVA